VQLVFLLLLALGFYNDVRLLMIILLPASLIVGNLFCSWMCPFGALQELMGAIGSKITKKKFRMPQSIQKYLKFSRYIWMGIVASNVIVYLAGLLDGYHTFFNAAENFTMSLAVGFMLFYLVLSLFFDRPYCNYLCTEGIKFGVLSLARPYSIKRVEDTCINCGKCDKSCPMNISISTHPHVRSAQCINCMACIQACPVEKTLIFTRVPYKKK